MGFVKDKDTGQRWLDIWKFRFHLPWNQWKEFRFARNDGWANIDLIKIEFEYAPYKGDCELQIALLGFCFCAEFSYGHGGPALQEAIKRAEQVKNWEAEVAPVDLDSLKNKNSQHGGRRHSHNNK